MAAGQTIGRRIIRALGVIVVAALAVELVARALFGLGWVRPAPVLVENRGSIRLHPRWGFALHPGVYDGKHINRWGLRGPDFEEAKRPGCARILMLGDSTTFGNRVKDDESYPAVVRRLLAERHPGRCFEVINAGIESGSSYQQLLRTRDLYVRFRPDVVTVNLGWNDLTCLLMTGDAFAEDDVSTTPSYIVELRPQRRAWLRRSATWQLVRSSSARWRFARNLRRLGTDPSPEATLAPATRAFARNVAGIADELRPLGARVVLVRQPWLFRDDRQAEELAQVRQMSLPPQMSAALPGIPPRLSIPASFARAAAPVAQRPGVTAVDCTPLFAAVPIEKRLALFNDVIHPSPAGYEVLGRCLADALEPLVAVPPASARAPAPASAP